MTLTLAEAVAPADKVFILDGCEPGLPLDRHLYRLEFEVVRFEGRWAWPRGEVHPAGRERWRVSRGRFYRPAWLPGAHYYFSRFDYTHTRGTTIYHDPNGPEGPTSPAVTHDAGTELRRAPRLL